MTNCSDIRRSVWSYSGSKIYKKTMEQNTDNRIIDNIVPSDWVPINSMIKVVGVGGGGCNAISYMYSKGVSGCLFYACNTDQKTLEKCNVPNLIRIGNGFGAGARPEVGRNSALEAAEQIRRELVDDNTEMVFVTASLGGGTGTGAAPVVAGICKDAGILTIGVVTLPFATEGLATRMRALDGLDSMKEAVDSLIVIDNNRLYKHYGKLSIRAAFNKVDEVLSTAVEGILGIIEKTGYINVDLNDVKTMMRDSGMALMGKGSGTGENRVDEAIKEAIESPLLNNYDFKKATKVLVNITCSNSDDGLTMNEVESLEGSINNYLGVTENYKKGIVFSEDPGFGDKVEITLIATGVEMMRAVPEDYYSELRAVSQKQEEKPEEAVTEVELSMEDLSQPAIVPERGIIKTAVTRIRTGISKMYDEIK